MRTAPTKMLIVNDQPTACTLFRKTFTGLGYAVRCARDGASALVEIKRRIPDILIADLNMPGMSSFELLALVRSRYSGVYVLANSGNFSSTHVPQGIAADAFYDKASSLLSLVQLVEAARGHTVSQHLASKKPVPLWLLPGTHYDVDAAEVLINCPDCLRAFPLQVSKFDFVVHQASSSVCNAEIHHTARPVKPKRPRTFPAEPHTILDCFANRLIGMRPQQRIL